jgi:hypothetical protein
MKRYYDGRMKKRYHPEKSFPDYIFVPGKNPHPKKSGGHMEGEAEPVAPALDELKPGESEFLRYSLDLFNHGYFWESHVYFEALWNAHGREGNVADFLKGMIKLAAAGVKLAIDQREHARGHYERAAELFQKVMTEEGPYFLGFHLESLLQNITRTLAHDLSSFEVHPSWE